MPPKSSRNKLIIVVVVVVGLVVVLSLLAARQPVQKPIPKAQEVSNSLNDNLPVQTPDYRIDYSYSPASKQFVYQVTLYAIINRPSQHDQYIAQLKQFKQEALGYIHQHGADPSTLNIQYIPVAATDL